MNKPDRARSRTVALKLDTAITDRRADFTARLRSLTREYKLGTATAALLFADEHLTREVATGRPLSAVDAGAPPVSVASLSDRPAASHFPPNTDPTPTLIVPGLLGGSVRQLVAPLAFAELALELQNYDIKVAWVSGRHGCDRNAQELHRQVMAAAEKHGQAVHLIGYSKGCADALHLLVNHPSCHDALRSVTSLAGVVGGTPLVADSPRWMDLLLQYLPLPGVPFGDGLALDHLDPGFRHAWLEQHALPDSIRYASVVATPSLAQVSRLLRRSWRQLAVFDRYNDGQVIAGDAMIPGSELLAVVNADHWAIALPIGKRLRWLSPWLVDPNEFPRTLLLQAIIDHLDADLPAAAGTALS